MPNENKTLGGIKKYYIVENEKFSFHDKSFSIRKMVFLGKISG